MLQRLLIEAKMKRDIGILLQTRLTTPRRTSPRLISPRLCLTPSRLASSRWFELLRFRPGQTLTARLPQVGPATTTCVVEAQDEATAVLSRVVVRERAR